MKENEETQSKGSVNRRKNARFPRKTGPKLKENKFMTDVLRKQNTVNLRKLKWFTKNEM